MSDQTLLRLHLLDLQAQVEHQVRSLRKVLAAVSDGRGAAVAVAELGEIATRALKIAETASDARLEALNRVGAPCDDSAST